MVAFNFNYGFSNAPVMPAALPLLAALSSLLQNFTSNSQTFSPLSPAPENQTAGASNFGAASFGDWMHPSRFGCLPFLFGPIIIINNNFANGVFQSPPSQNNGTNGVPQSPSPQTNPSPGPGQSSRGKFDGIFNSRRNYDGLFKPPSQSNPLPGNPAPSISPPAPNTDQLWNRLDMLDGQNGYVDLFMLGYLFNEIDSLNRDGALDQNEVNAWAARNGNALNLSNLLVAGSGRITFEAFRNYFMQRDTNHDNQWNRDEFDGTPPLPGAVPTPPSLNWPVLSQPTPGAAPPSQPQTPGQPNQQAPADSNSSSQPSQGNPPNSPDSSGSPQPPANPQQAAPQNPPATTGKDGVPPQQDQGKKQADAKKPALPPDQRFHIADIADNKEHKSDNSIDLAGLIKALDNDHNGTDEKEYGLLADLLGLKTPFSELEKDKTTGRASEAAVLKAAKEGDENNDDKLSREEFDKMNPPAPAKDRQPDATQDVNNANNKEAAAQKVAPPQGKPKYFELNTDYKHGVTQHELVEFLKTFADQAGGRFSAEQLHALLTGLGWDKARFAQSFLNDLKAGMSAADIADVLFGNDKLDHDHNGRLVRGELGDLVTGNAEKHRRHRRHHIRAPAAQ
jgi:hypothetical protein